MIAADTREAAAADLAAVLRTLKTPERVKRGGHGVALAFKADVQRARRIVNSDRAPIAEMRSLARRLADAS